VQNRTIRRTALVQCATAKFGLGWHAHCFLAKTERRRALVTKLACNMLEFVRDNVKQKTESLTEARKFVRHVEGHLSDTERLFLDCALHSRAHLQAFSSKIKK
jgi:hypothetical protein